MRRHAPLAAFAFACVFTLVLAPPPPPDPRTVLLGHALGVRCVDALVQRSFKAIGSEEGDPGGGLRVISCGKRKHTTPSLLLSLSFTPNLKKNDGLRLIEVEREALLS